MKRLLSDIAEIKAGHPFRGKIPEVGDGEAYVIQIRNINEDGDIEWNQLVRTNITGRKSPDWLVNGDVLFAARGQRNIAACITDINRPTVCAPHYFVIKVHSDKAILPEFLAWQLNQLPAQKYFAQAAEGSLQLSIRRPVLESLQVTIPSMPEQAAIIGLYNQVKKEKQTYNALIENRSKQMQYVASNLLGEKINLKSKVKVNTKKDI